MTRSCRRSPKVRSRSGAKYPDHNELRLPHVVPATQQGTGQDAMTASGSRSSSPLIRALAKQQAHEVAWLAGLRQQHHENQLDHEKAMSLVTGRQHSTSHMRQLAQAEVDWTNFRSAIELYHDPGSQRQRRPADDTSPVLAESSSSLSFAGCSPRTASASECSPRSDCVQGIPRSPRVQARPYTAPTIVSRQPLHDSTDSPCYVSSMYKGKQQAKLHLRYQLHADSNHSMQSVFEEDSMWSSHQPCSPVEPYLRSKSGGIAQTYGSRERDRPHTSGGVITAEPNVSGGSTSRSKGGKLINTMRESGHVAEEPKAQSHIVARSKAWPASSDGHPVGSGLTVRQQACFLGKSSLAKHEQKLAERYGPWLQDLSSGESHPPADSDAQRLSIQTQMYTPRADDAMTPQICTTGPV